MSSRQQRRAAARAAAKQTRAEINRQNAQHSTGPCTEAGKAKSCQNSFKHGLYSKQLCTSAEEVAELDALKSDLRAEHQPGNQTEEILVNEMAEQYWRIKRARRLEAQILDGSGAIPQLAAAQRMMSAAERGFHKALATLRQLQAERGFVPQNVEQPQSEAESAGFVPQNLEQPKVAEAGASGFVPQNEPEASVARSSVPPFAVTATAGAAQPGC